jgi:hypothetical protein
MFSRKVTLNCYTDRPYAYEHAKVKKGVADIPEWWKNLPPSGFNWKDKEHSNYFTLFSFNTMRSCPAFIELFRKSFTISMWSDLRINIGSSENPVWSAQYSDAVSHVSAHDDFQWGEFFSSRDYQHLKITPPWYFKTSKNIDFAWVPATWNHLTSPQEMIVFPGIDNYSITTGTDINMAFKRDSTKDTALTLKYQTPLVHLIPITDRKVELKHHLVSSEELEKIKAHNTAITFANSYYKKKDLLKRGKK